MAGNGPMPKPDAERRRTNKPTYTWTVLPAAGRPGPPPDLPELTPEGRPWSQSTGEWWAHWWTSPQATQWDPHDDGMRRLAALRERFWRGEATGADTTEMRNLEREHGMNPKGLDERRWRIGDVEDEPDTTPRKRAPAKKKVDPRRKAAMKLIEGGG